MAETKHDDNQVPVMMGVLNTDGVTPIRIKIDPTTHVLDAMDDTTGSDFGTDNAVRDNSGYPTMIAVSSADGATPVTLYADSSGNLLVDAS